MGESIASEVIAASLGGAFSAAALYPLEVLKTKMQAESKQAAAVTTNSMKDNNDKNRGTDDEKPIVNEESTSPSSSSSVEEMKSKSSAKKSISMIEYARDMYAQYGIRPFYSGIETSAFQSSVEKALYFFAYTAMKNVYTFFSGSEKHMGTSVNLLLGCLAEWAHLPITLPLDCWTTQIQTGDNGNKKPLAILMSMLSEGDGIRGMYKGIQAYYVLCLKPAIQYTVFEQVKRIMLMRKKLLKNGLVSNDKNQQETLTATEAFILGMVARTIATVAVFPYLRAKVMLQSQKTKGGTSDSSAANSTPNIPSMILQMYSSGGLGECFQGIGPELTRGVFSAALMLMCKEKISFVVQKALKATE